MIPRIDPEVKYKGSSYLRTLNAENLRELTGAVVIQDAGSEPLVVILPYQTYLKMQGAAHLLDGSSPILSYDDHLSIKEPSRGPRPKGDKTR